MRRREPLPPLPPDRATEAPAPPRPSRPLPAAAADANAGLYEPARMIGMVGTLPILAGDLLPQITQILRENADKIPPGQVEAQKRMMMQAMTRWK